jgi:hypothetical protein
MTKELRQEYQRAYYQAHKDKWSRYHLKRHPRKLRAEWTEERLARVRSQCRAHYAANKQAWREADLKRKYSLSLDDFDALIEKQGNRCAACGTPDWGKRGPVVDHDHETGKVRGILCNTCNLVAGLFDDDCERFLRLVEYLKSSKQEKKADK